MDEIIMEEEDVSSPSLTVMGTVTSIKTSRLGFRF